MCGESTPATNPEGSRHQIREPDFYGERGKIGVEIDKKIKYVLVQKLPALVREGNSECPVLRTCGQVKTRHTVRYGAFGLVDRQRRHQRGRESDSEEEAGSVADAATLPIVVRGEVHKFIE